MCDQSKLIAQYNDMFRKAFGHSDPSRNNILGKHCLSSGVASLPPEQQEEAVSKIRDFNEFNEANDPHGEHDCGRIQLEESKQAIFWKIDYYDTEYKYSSENPACLEKTRRVLTAMLVCEY